MDINKIFNESYDVLCDIDRDNLHEDDRIFLNDLDVVVNLFGLNSSNIKE